MKKKSHQKITLSRETLRSLDGSNLGKAAGGESLGPRCNSLRCGDTWSDCYITACAECTFTCPV